MDGPRHAGAAVGHDDHRRAARAVGRLRVLLRAPHRVQRHGHVAPDVDAHAVRLRVERVSGQRLHHAPTRAGDHIAVQSHRHGPAADAHPHGALREHRWDVDDDRRPAQPDHRERVSG